MGCRGWGGGAFGAPDTRRVGRRYCSVTRVILQNRKRERVGETNSDYLPCRHATCFFPLQRTLIYPQYLVPELSSWDLARLDNASSNSHRGNATRSSKMMKDGLTNAADLITANAVHE